VPEYDEGPWRAWSRSTLAHNTVTLENLDQCEFHGAFRVGRRAAAVLERFEVAGPSVVVEGRHDAFARLAGRPRHVRRLTAAPGSLRVEDFVEGGAGQRVSARLLLHPDARVEQGLGGLRIHLGREQLELDCEHPVRVVDTWWCPDFGERRRTRQLVLQYGQAPCSGTFALRSVPSTVASAGRSGYALGRPG
jgi:uncharacterized heparinase superfamily protein